MKYGYYIENRLPKKVCELEQEDMLKSKDVFYLARRDEEMFNPFAFLYHGIRFDNSLIKLENILKEKKILAGKHIKGHYNYYDNANKGEYVSLTRYSNERLSGYEVFVKNNICLLVSIDCDAFLTKYVDFNTWEKIKDDKTKNLYSYMDGEFMVKDFIPLEYIRAIGVPYEYFVLANGKEYANDILSKIKKLMSKYNVNLAIVDTSSHNKVLIDKNNLKIKR